MKENTRPPLNEAQRQLELRAESEVAMLKDHDMRKQMLLETKPKIDSEAVRKATEILRKYKEGKARLEQKIIANEEFWKLRQWNYIEDGDNQAPATAWLWSCIQSRHADVMDGYPTCNFQPRQEDDKAEALMLSSIVPVILEQNRYEEVYSDVAWYSLKHGGNIQGIFWDGTKHNGLGDVAIKKIDFINLFWEPGITDIQASQNVFNTELVSNSILEQKYPQCIGKLNAKTITLAKYLYDDSVDTSDKSVVVDWYYHTYYNGRKVLQYVKFVNDIVLYATENEVIPPEQTVIDPQTNIPVITPTGEAMAVRGLYDHALYPFVTMALYPIEGSICGYGLTDIGRDTQIIIDKLNEAIVDNALEGATPRYFNNNDGVINEKEFLDKRKKIVHIEGQLDDNHLRAIDHKPLDGIYVNFLSQKIDEMKFITSNQDANNGTAPSGITAASAIAALQETAGKASRDTNKAFYRQFRDVCYQIVELIRQFYDAPRKFRINPDGMESQFVTYSNAGLKPQQQMTMGMEMGFRLPEFDIDISAEKANPYKKMEINELALSFYNAGFFNPQMSDQALAALTIMDFSKKDEVIQKITENGTLAEMLAMYQQMALELAEKVDPNLAEQLAQQILQQGGQAIIQSGTVSSEETTAEDGEHPFVERARNEARNSTQVD